jgi:hypothetical protein
VLAEGAPHPLVRLYGQERDRAARVAREAVALGLEERRVRLDEAVRGRMAQVFLAALADPELGLSAEQLEAAPKVARASSARGRSDAGCPARPRDATTSAVAAGMGDPPESGTRIRG